MKKDERRYLPRGYQIEAENGECFHVCSAAGKGGTALTYYAEKEIEGQEEAGVYMKELYPADCKMVRQAGGNLEPQGEYETEFYHKMQRYMVQEQTLGNRIKKLGISGVYPMDYVIKDRNTGNVYGIFYQCPPSMSLEAFVEQLREKGENVSLRAKVHYILDVSHIIHALHEQGRFFHLDISPGNLLLTGASCLMDLEYKGRTIPGLLTLSEDKVRAAVIDFACAVKIGKNGQTAAGDVEIDDLIFHTNGFTAPELLGSDPVITAAADVFSITACLWYFVTGQPPYQMKDGSREYQEWVDFGFLAQCLNMHEVYALKGDIKKQYGRNPRKVSKDVIRQFERIFRCGLSGFRDQRYRSIEDLERDLQELLALIEGSNLSESGLWEKSRKFYLEQRSSDKNRYDIVKAILPTARRFENQEIFYEDTAEEKKSRHMEEYLQNGKSIYAIGEGGTGKTTSLLYLADGYYKEEEYSDASTIVVYMELNQIPTRTVSGNGKKGHTNTIGTGDTDENGAEKDAADAEKESLMWMDEQGRPVFIEQYLAGILYGCGGMFAAKDDLMIGAVKQKLCQTPFKNPKYLILLDGLNEMYFVNTEEKQKFMDGINWYLKHAANARLILTSRYQEYGISHDNISRIRVLGLTRETIEACLRKACENGNLSVNEYQSIMASEKTGSLWKCLEIPLFLNMYCNVTDRSGINSAGEILKQFFHDKKESADGTDLYTEKNLGESKYKGVLFAKGLDLYMARRYMLDFLLPEIGFAMIKKRLFFMNREEIMEVLHTAVTGDECTRSDVLCMLVDKEFWYYDASAQKRILRSMESYYQYKVSLDQISNRMRDIPSEQILDFIYENIGVLGKSNDGIYYFTHQYFRDYFAAVGIINRFLCAVSCSEDLKKKEFAEKSRIIELEMEFLNDRLPDSVLEIAGQCLGIHHTVPYWDNDCFRQGDNKNKLFESVLDLCRCTGNGLSSPDRRRKQPDEEYDNFIEHSKKIYENLIRILKLCRRTNGKPDFSGLDLSCLNLNEKDFYGTILSRPDRNRGEAGEDRGLYANLTHMIGENHDWMPKEDKGWYMIRLHPMYAYLLYVYVQKDGYVVEEIDLETGERHPYGTYESIKALSYSPDGEKIVFLSENKRWHCFDRKTVRHQVTDMPMEEFFRYIQYKRGRNENELYLFGVDAKGMLVLATLESHRKECTIKKRPIPQIRDWIEYQFEIIDGTRVAVTDGNSVALLDANTNETRIVYFKEGAGIKCLAADSNRPVLYAAGSGQVTEIDWEKGKEKEILSVNVWDMVYGQNYLAVVSEDELYIWDCQREVVQMRMKHGLLQPKQTQCRLTVSERFAVIVNDMQYKVFDIYSGKEIFVSEEKRRGKHTYVWKSPVSSPVGLTILDEETEALYFYEKENYTCCGYSFPELDYSHVYAICADWAQNRLLVCTPKGIEGYDLDSGKNLRQDKTPLFPLPEGLKKRVRPEVFALSEELKDDGIRKAEENSCVFEILNAKFAPGGQSAILEIRYTWKNCFPLYRERNIYEWNFTEEQPFVYQYPEIKTVEFSAEDIEKGIDSGVRYLVMEKVRKEKIQPRKTKNIFKIMEEVFLEIFNDDWPEYEDEDIEKKLEKNDFMHDYWQGILDRRKKKQNQEELRKHMVVYQKKGDQLTRLPEIPGIQIPFVFRGESWGGIGNLQYEELAEEHENDFGFQYCDERHREEIRQFLMESDADEEGQGRVWEEKWRKVFLKRSCFVPTEDGFLQFLGRYVKSYQINGDEMLEKEVCDDPSDWNMGCPGIKELRHFPKILLILGKGFQGIKELQHARWQGELVERRMARYLNKNKETAHTVKTFPLIGWLALMLCVGLTVGMAVLTLFVIPEISFFQEITYESAGIHGVRYLLYLMAAVAGVMVLYRLRFTEYLRHISVRLIVVSVVALMFVEYSYQPGNALNLLEIMLYCATFLVVGRLLMQSDKRGLRKRDAGDFLSCLLAVLVPYWCLRWWAAEGIRRELSMTLWMFFVILLNESSRVIKKGGVLSMNIRSMTTGLIGAIAFWAVGRCWVILFPENVIITEEAIQEGKPLMDYFTVEEIAIRYGVHPGFLPHPWIWENLSNAHLFSGNGNLEALFRTPQTAGIVPILMNSEQGMPGWMYIFNQCENFGLMLLISCGGYVKGLLFLMPMILVLAGMFYQAGKQREIERYVTSMGVAIYMALQLLMYVLSNFGVCLNWNFTTCPFLLTSWRNAVQFSLMMGLYFSAVHNSRRDTGIVVKYEKENHSDKDEESSDEVLEDVNMEDRS